MQKTKHYYVGRREFLEVLDKSGSIVERRFTGYDFDGWFASAPYGPIWFKPKWFDPPWADLVDDRRPYERDAVRQVGSIHDHAPRGFGGPYMHTAETHCGVPKGFYFKTFSFGVVVAFDAGRGTFYISATPFDEILQAAVGMDVDHYCRSYFGKRATRLNRKDIPGVVCGAFVPLSAVRPLLEDLGRSSGKRIRALSILAKELRNVDDVGSSTRPNYKRLRHLATKAGVMFDPRDGNKFKVFVCGGQTVIYCANGHIDRLERAALVGGDRYRKAILDWARDYDIRKVNGLRSDVAPVLEYIDAGNGVRRFRSHDGADAVGMFADKRGRTFVNLHDLLVASRVDLFRDMRGLVGGNGVYRNDLPCPSPIYDMELKPRPDYAHAIFGPDDALLPVSSAIDLFTMIMAKHRSERTGAFMRAPPRAMSRLCDVFGATEQQYDRLGKYEP